MKKPRYGAYRKTKIIATLGPVTDKLETLEEMIKAGMNVARINLSHGNFREQAGRVRLVRQAAKNLNTHVAVMVDTKGVEIRTGSLGSDSVKLEVGNPFFLTATAMVGNAQGVSISYGNLVSYVSKGDTILLDDGAIELEVTETTGDKIQCVVKQGGLLGERKGINLPRVKLATSTVDAEFIENLKQEIGFAVEQKVDYLAASFIQSSSEIHEIRSLLLERDFPIPIIAKIENNSGVNNADSIAEVADGIMVARGDLGVELPLAEVPGTQKKLIKTSVNKGKPAITATQMLASMETSLKPTRAEASDVANAILDGTSAIMLSGETAKGQYPIEVVEVMSALAIRAEAYLDEFGLLQTVGMDETFKITEAIGQASTRVARQLKAAAIIALTESGFSARLISKHRPQSLILAVTPSERVACRLALNWGVIPLLYKGDFSLDDEVSTSYGCKYAKKLGLVRSGDVCVVTHGTRTGIGGTDLIRVVKID